MYGKTGGLNSCGDQPPRERQEVGWGEVATITVGKKEAACTPRCLQLSLGCDDMNPGAPGRRLGAGSEALFYWPRVLPDRSTEQKRDFLSVLNLFRREWT